MKQSPKAQYSILWPTDLDPKTLQYCLDAQRTSSTSISLMHNHQNMAFWRPQLESNSLHHTLLYFSFLDNLQNKQYRNQRSDALCFLAEKYLANNTQNLYLQLKTDLTPKQPQDFIRYLSDIFYFLDERLADKYQNLELIPHQLLLSFQEILLCIKSTQSTKKPLTLAFSPYFWSFHNIDVIKHSFLYRPFTTSILLQDKSYDGLKEVFPGEGLTLNQTAIEIALEKHKKIACIFQPNAASIENKNSIEVFFKKCEYFIGKII